MIWPGLAKAIGLNNGAAYLDMLNDKQVDIIDRLFIEYEGKDSLGECIFDRIADHNKKCRSEGHLDDLMKPANAMGNYNLFQIAGTDTSQNTTKMALCHMADKPELKQIIDDIDSQIYDGHGSTTSQKLAESEHLNMWIKEALRIHNPVTRLSFKHVIKDFKLGKYNIQKGTLIQFSLVGLNFNERVFKHPEQFDITRFSKENEKSIPKYHYIPFSVGKRMCLGRHLGELMLKLLVTQFCRTFDFSKPEGVEYYESTTATHSVDNPFLDVKLK